MILFCGSRCIFVYREPFVVPTRPPNHAMNAEAEFLFQDRGVLGSKVAGAAEDFTTGIGHGC